MLLNMNLEFRYDSDMNVDVRKSVGNNVYFRGAEQRKTTPSFHLQGNKTKQGAAR